MTYKGLANTAGKGTFEEGMYSLTSVFNYVHTDPVYAGDVTGDGRTDLVVHWQENGKRRLLSYTANADGSFTEGNVIYSERSHNPDVYPCKLYMADATGDGKQDFIVHWCDSNNKRNIMVYKGVSLNGTAQFEEGYYALSSTRAYVEEHPVYVGDMNGDGRADMMVHWGLNGYRQVLIYYAAANGTYNEGVNTATSQLYDPITYPGTEHLMDVNGDGKEDFVLHWRRPDYCVNVYNYPAITGGVGDSVQSHMHKLPYYVYL
jgi:hypothetical protein